MAGPKNSRFIDGCPAPGGDPVSGILADWLGKRLSSLSAVPLRLCVALSGGRDSVVLLHALKVLAAERSDLLALSALHVHHGISANADEWAGFCERLCADWAVPLRVVHVEVPRDSGEGLEGAARRIRHGVFAGCECDCLALAHHRDDQVETVLLNLLRGAGVAGAAAMRAERSQGKAGQAHGLVLARPLLAVSRAEIEAYAAQHELCWIDDESNNDPHFRRNYLRHEIMPRLEEKFPGVQKSLARAAGHFAEAADLLDDLARLDRAVLLGPSGRIAVSALNALPRARACNLLRHQWAAAGFRAPDERWVNEALQQLATADAQSEICLTTVDGALHVYRDELHIQRHQAEASGSPVLWSGEMELPWAGGRVRFVPTVGSGIRRSVLDAGCVELRGRQGGERLQVHPHRPRRSLRKLLQEAAVPPWERNRLPLLWGNERLLWVGGQGVDVAFVCAPGEEGVLPLWESK